MPNLPPKNEILAWHFSTGELRYDHERTAIINGLILQTQDEPVAEKSGFHACQSPLDALKYFAVRPNDRKVVSRVKLGGKIIKDKANVIGYFCERLTAQRREHLWVANIEETLETFVYLNFNKSFDWLRKW